MTPEQFDNTAFGKGMTIKYHGEVYVIAAIDFEERLIGYIEVENLDKYLYNLEKLSWCRCENCELSEEVVLKMY